ncbi:MAG TPA: cytochrome c [Paraburkholderia sp.]|jgi:cytochrome c553|nr:cytochrome c [Paraburkholderia sp.]
MNQPFKAARAARAFGPRLRTVVTVGALAGAAALHPAFAADAARGKTLADSHNCAACHGPGLNQPISPDYPRLAGQHADYVFWALRQYQMGTGNPNLGRNNPIMQAQVQTLSEADLRDIAAYIESLPGSLVNRK